ncbi:MAG: sporulation protein [SAR324 cluster bacterium]|nr:sporulation protein [SAR324 cluster bacterium]
MKGLFFAKPIEFRLETPADTLVQGEVMEGQITAVNRGQANEKGLRLQVGLAYGDFKAIKENEADALEIVERQNLGKKFSLKPGDEHRAEWRFQLPHDCPITSSEGSLFLLYGRELEESGARSKIDLRVQLTPVLETVISSIENHFAFAAKSRIHTNGFTEVSFKPPSSYPTLDEMTVLMRVREKEGMDLHFHCRTKTFNRAAGKGLKARTVKFEHNYPRNKYLIYNSQPNRALFRSVIEEVLAKATPGKVTKR